MLRADLFCSTTSPAADVDPPDATAGQRLAWRPTGEPVIQTGASLPTLIAASERPVVVDFWAGWSEPSRAMTSPFAAAAMLLPEVCFVTLDNDTAPDSTAGYGISSIPTLILFLRGVEIARVSGALPTAQLVAWIQERLRLGEPDSATHPDARPSATAIAAAAEGGPVEDRASSATEAMQLRVRVIALENLLIALLSQASETQLERAREMAAYISPRAGCTPHPLTLRAADEMRSLVDRAKPFRTSPAG